MKQVIHETAIVHEGAQLGDDVIIGAYSEIGRHAYVGDGCRIERAVVEGTVGPHSMIWRWAHVMPGASVGSFAMLAQGTFVADGAVLGSSCRMHNGAGIGRLAMVGDNCYIGPNVMFANSPDPLANPDNLLPIIVGRDVMIGANAVLVGGIRLGDESRVAAGAVVTKDVPHGATVKGVPAR